MEDLVGLAVTKMAVMRTATWLAPLALMLVVLFTGTALLSCSSAEETQAASAEGSEGATLEGTSCDEDERQCQGSTLFVCRDAQLREAESCSTEQLCQDTLVLCGISPAACPQECLPASCEVGETQCAGSRVLLCNENRTGFSPEKNCGAVCSGPGGRHCFEGACRRDVCDSAGEFFDAIGDIADCNDDCSVVTYPFGVSGN